MTPVQQHDVDARARSADAKGSMRQYYREKGLIPPLVYGTLESEIARAGI